MCKNLKDCIHIPITLSPRETVLGFIACVMTGVVIGMLISPRKNMTIGSHNNNVEDYRTVTETPDVTQEDTPCAQY